MKGVLILNVSDPLSLNFAYFLYQSLDPFKAAKLSNVSKNVNPIELLFDKNLKKNLRKINSISGALSTLPLVRNALQRIIFSSSPSAVMASLDSGESLSDDDAFAIAEIKKPKTGGLEVRFFDKLKAIELLHSIDSESAQKNTSLFEAIHKSADALRQSTTCEAMDDLL